MLETSPDIGLSDEAWDSYRQEIQNRLAAKELRLMDPHIIIPELVLGDEAPFPYFFEKE